MNALQKKCFRLVWNPDQNKWGNIFERLIVSLILISILLQVLESFEDLYTEFEPIFFTFDLVILAIFTFEYVMRIWTASLNYQNLRPLQARIKYITSGSGMIDFIAIAPFYLPFFLNFDARFLRIIRLSRLLRVLKLKSFSNSLNVIRNVLNDTKSELIVIVTFILTLMLITSILVFEIEHGAQPEKFSNIPKAYLWAVAQMSVGCATPEPITLAGKTLSAIITILSIGIVAIPSGILSSGFMGEVQRRKKDENGEGIVEFTYCPHCGKQFKE